MYDIIELFKFLIVDGQMGSRFSGTARRRHIESLDGKATVVVGARRAGKSTLMNQIIRQLLANDVSPENICQINFFDDRLRGLDLAGLGLVLQAYYGMFPDKKDREVVHFFFDEIQLIEGWESFIDRLLRTERCTVRITGSSAKLLSKEIATQMRGRALTWELFPFSFHEYLDHMELKVEKTISSKRRFEIQKAFAAYFECGGFPEVLNLNRSLRVKIHQEYYHSILFRDLIERHDISYPKAAMDLAHWFINNNASMYSINRLTGYLKSLGHKIPKALVADYIKWFEDAYFLFSVPIFDASVARTNTNPKKTYCIDHSLVKSVGAGLLLNSGHLLENLVFVALRRVTEKVSYFRTQDGREVDFVLRNQNRQLQLIQVSESLAVPETRAREIGALEIAMAELNVSSSVIVTKSTEETIKVGRSRTIHVVSAWKYLLNIEENLDS